MSFVENFKPVHPFPARMAPSFALEQLKNRRQKSGKVLDPMVGSGTILVAARAQGYEAIGFDTDPLALIIANTWSMNIDPKKIRDAASKVFENASEKYKQIKNSEAFPLGSDDETKKFVKFWFSLKNRKQLKALSQEIENIKNSNIQRVLWCAFSRLIIAKSKGVSWAMDLSHSRPHKVLDKPTIDALPNFIGAVEYVLKRMPFLMKDHDLPKAVAKRGDARRLPIENDTIDIVITSPPYLNAIDYMRCNKFSLVWMGHQIPELRKLRSSNIGAESAGTPISDSKVIEIMNEMGEIKKLSKPDQRTLSRYIKDMDSVVREIQRVLKKNGECIFVIGDCNIKGTFIKNSEALIGLGKLCGLKLIKEFKRPLPDNRRYLPSPSYLRSGKAFQNRMREEIIIRMINEK